MTFRFFCALFSGLITVVVALAQGVEPIQPAPIPEPPSEVPPVPPAVPTPPAPVTPAVPEVVQALSYEQMSGIVLIEGDGGTATGFMTKIRGVDFVVTNLHVLSGNKKISLKTLRGEEIPMLGIFGAAGSDIALIRITSGQGDLRLAEDVFKTSKIGDKVVVVGNRRGGGVATQLAGNIMGIGPTRVEVNANFEPGNSGSPIMNLTTGEVVGVASYSETRRIEVEESGDKAAKPSGTETEATKKVEKRWFGYRVDSVTKWEAIDLEKLNAQSERVEKFHELSDALVDVLKMNFNDARRHPRLNATIFAFEARLRAAGGGSLAAGTEVKDFFRVIRTLSEDGVNDLKNGDYYDYFRTCLYWEDNIPAQLEYRRDITDALRKYEANPTGFLSRMRGRN
jgi:serine protease Do